MVTPSAGRGHINLVAGARVIAGIARAFDTRQHSRNAQPSDCAEDGVKSTILPAVIAAGGV